LRRTIYAALSHGSSFFEFGTNVLISFALSFIAILILSYQIPLEDSPAKINWVRFMMTQKVEAVYENGVLKPLQPLTLAEHQRVALMIRPLPPLDLDEILELARQVYEGLSDEEIAEIEAMALDRSNFMRPAE
jgi:predicted DNA-binding antitoxin AbrB/MazE fold protein